MIRPVPATTRNSRTAESEKVLATADRGSAPDEETSVWALPLVTMTTAARAIVLINAFAASQAPCRPNIRFTPGKGLSFFRLGFIPFAAKLIPPWLADAA